MRRQCHCIINELCFSSNLGKIRSADVPRSRAPTPGAIPNGRISFWTNFVLDEFRFGRISFWTNFVLDESKKRVQMDENYGWTNFIFPPKFPNIAHIREHTHAHTHIRWLVVMSVVMATTGVPELVYQFVFGSVTSPKHCIIDARNSGVHRLYYGHLWDCTILNVIEGRPSYRHHNINTKYTKILFRAKRTGRNTGAGRSPGMTVGRRSTVPNKRWEYSNIHINGLTWIICLAYAYYTIAPFSC